MNPPSSFFTALFLMVAFSLNAQTIIEPTKQGQDLINALRATYTPNQTLGYDRARDTMYAVIDNDGTNVIKGIYTDFAVTWTPGTDPSSTIYLNGNGINAEHIYPQSMGADSEPARSNLFNLRPSKVNVNAERGNCPFAEIPDQNTDTWFRLANSQTTTPTTNLNEWSEKENQFGCAFEPRESVKGDIARSIFYFYTIYQTQANAANPTFFNGMKPTLLNWHYADPVDASELTRNNRIKTYQGKDNPFILDSTLARRAFFLTTSTNAQGLDNQTVTIFPNPVQSQLFFSIPVQNVRIFNLNGQILMTIERKNSLTSVSVEHLPKGLYLMEYTLPDGKKFKSKFLKE